MTGLLPPLLDFVVGEDTPGRSCLRAYGSNAAVRGKKPCFTKLNLNQIPTHKQEHSSSTSQRNNSSRNGHVFTASHLEEKLSDNTWILDSGASCHMAKESVWFKNISPEVMDIYLTDKNSKMMSQGIGNVSAKTGVQKVVILLI
ncbi:retrovirus-related Pol polyprotein from transposon TNT 1-94 [Trichonephila clavipes]|nr:retrovirus-related Pol polyprotein from transposon TNT 1-94 [Trichonephila clavipes]